MKWQHAIQEYTNYLRIERGLSPHSVAAYQRDVEKLKVYITAFDTGISPLMIDAERIHQFIYEVAKLVSPRTQSRIISGLRSFF